MQKVNNMRREVQGLKIFKFSQSTLLINMMKDSLKGSFSSFLSHDGQSFFSVYISMFWLCTVDLHQVMVLIFPSWMFNFMLFMLVLGTTALWLHYISKNIVGGALFAQKKSSKEKYNSVCTFKKALNVEEVPTLSFTTINSSGFFFLSNIKKKIMWSGDQKKKPRKGNHLSFLASFCDKKILSLQNEFLNMTGVYSLHLWKCELHFIVPKPEFILNKSEFNLIIKQ